MLGAEFMWGVSAPLGKVILAGGVTPLMLTDCRMVGAAALFGCCRCLPGGNVWRAGICC